ncbi:hypothetical protein [Mycoplasmopsis adleri]|uniref:hypothetical protein n=1 Tax=Mycoplasmopsis adleri TaxID=51362 RepID=UPI0038738E9B
MKFKLNKLLLPATASTLVAPVALVSCINPFKEEQGIKDAKYFSLNNNIFQGKSFAEFESKILAPKWGKEPKYEGIKKVFEKSFRDFTHQDFISLEEFYYQFLDISIPIYIKYNDPKTHKTVRANLNKDMIEAYLLYLFEDTPYQHRFLSSTHKEAYEKLLNPDAVEERIDFQFSNFTDDNEVEIQGILPKIALNNLFEDLSLRKDNNEANLLTYYKNIMQTLSKFINEYDAEHEHTIQQSFAPLYYLTRSPKGYLTSTYTVTNAGETSTFKGKYDKLPKNALEEFTKDPKKFVEEMTAKGYVSKVWLKNADWQEEFEKAVKNGGKVGKFGLAYFVAYLIYYQVPKNVQILQFKHNAGSTVNTRFLVQYSINNKLYLFDPVKDFLALKENKNINEPNYKLFYSTKEELASNNLSFDTTAYLSSEIGKPWK